MVAKKGKHATMAQNISGETHGSFRTMSIQKHIQGNPKQIQCCKWKNMLRKATTNTLTSNMLKVQKQSKPQKNNRNFTYQVKKHESQPERERERPDLLLFYIIVKDYNQIYIYIHTNIHTFLYVTALLHFTSRFKNKYTFSSGLSLGSCCSPCRPGELPLSWLDMQRFSVDFFFLCICFFITLFPLPHDPVKLHHVSPTGTVLAFCSTFALVGHHRLFIWSNNHNLSLRIFLFIAPFISVHFILSLAFLPDR